MMLFVITIDVDVDVVSDLRWSAGSTEAEELQAVNWTRNRGPATFVSSKSSTWPRLAALFSLTSKTSSTFLF